MNRAFDKEEFYGLIHAACEGILTAEQAARIEQVAGSSDEAMRLYVQCLCAHSLLERFDGASASPSAGPADRSTQPPSGLPARPSAAMPPAAPPSWSDLLGGWLGGTGSLFAWSRPGFLILLAAVGLSFAAGASLAWRSWTGVADRRAEPAAAPVQVARLSQGAGCRWNGAARNPGDRLAVGQPLDLVAGVAEITYDVGAKVVLQSPAIFTPESPLSGRLTAGKAAVEITTAAARGFTIHTPDASFLDQGTEFGVEVAPSGTSRVHVFKGEVEVSMHASGAAPRPTQRLMAHYGARLDGEMTLVADTGECFIRSIGEAERDTHVLAYWRFEDHPVGVLAPDTDLNRKQIRGSVDSSYNGNDLFTFCRQTGPLFSDDVPASRVPQGGAVNRGCLDNSSPPGVGAPTRDLYTRSQFSHAFPVDLQKVTPAQWTIEASVKPARLGQGRQTFVGRDAYLFTSTSETPPRLAFQIDDQDRFAIRFADAEGRFHEAIASQMAIEEHRWYHLAAVSDGRTLKLYVDALDDRGYRLEASTDLPSTGSTALGKLDDKAEWTVGRGRCDGRPMEWFQGWIDEVRISDAARGPAELLFAPQSRTTAKPSKEEPR